MEHTFHQSLLRYDEEAGKKPVHLLKMMVIKYGGKF